MGPANFCPGMIDSPGQTVIEGETGQELVVVGTLVAGLAVCPGAEHLGHHILLRALPHAAPAAGCGGAASRLPALLLCVPWALLEARPKVHLSPCPLTAVSSREMEKYQPL